MLVYMGPLFLGIGVYLAPILYFFDLYDRDYTLSKIGFQPEVPIENVNFRGLIAISIWLVLSTIMIAITVRTRKKKSN